MKLMSSFTRIGLVGLGFILVKIVSDASTWQSAKNPDMTPTNAGLASSLFNEWALPLMILGVLMAIAMIGAAYLVRDERRENLLWEFKSDSDDGGEEE